LLKGMLVLGQAPVNPIGHGWKSGWGVGGSAVTKPLQLQLELEGCAWGVTDSYCSGGAGLVRGPPVEGSVNFLRSLDLRCADGTQFTEAVPQWCSLPKAAWPSCARSGSTSIASSQRSRGARCTSRLSPSDSGDHACLLMSEVEGLSEGNGWFSWTEFPSHRPSVQ
jgi:hypothetical protein